MDIKDMFKLTDCVKSNSKLIHDWCWTFESKLTQRVQVDVTTFGITAEDKNEEDAWKELEKAIGVFGNQSK